VVKDAFADELLGTTPKVLVVVGSAEPGEFD
jgi:hypothetical protein